MRQFYVYILSSHSKRLYIGVTNDLMRRLFEHKHNWSDFTSRYRMNRLVHFECIPGALAAIKREKELKGWVRRKKVELIEETNPMWLDLSSGWFDWPFYCAREARDRHSELAKRAKNRP